MLRFYSTLILLAVLVSGCATISNPVKTPEIQLTGLRMLPVQGLEQPFEIRLKVVNPNRFDLNPVGMTYKLSIQGRQALSGATRDLPSLPAYGEAEVTLVAGINLINGLTIINQWLRQPDQALTYELSTELDIGGLWPNLDIVKSGEITLLE